MKKHFFTGLILLLPITLTIIIVLFLVRLLTSPFLDLAETMLIHYGIVEAPNGTFPQSEWLTISVKLLILVVLGAITLLIGILGNWALSSTLFRFTGKFFKRIPFFSKIYKATQDVVKTLFNSKGSSFAQVVLIPFPHQQAYSMGFLPQHLSPDSTPETEVSVFMPATPNPTTGFMMKFPCRDLVLLDMKVEDALKYLISCGSLPAEFQQTQST